MGTRVTFLSGVAVGYVLGARAGRERYEQIAQQARRLWENPQVQQTVGDVQERATQTASATAHQIQDKVSHTAKDLAATAKEKAHDTVEAARHHREPDAAEGRQEVVLTTYDSTTGEMETTTVDISDSAGANNRPS